MSAPSAASVAAVVPPVAVPAVAPVPVPAQPNGRAIWSNHQLDLLVNAVSEKRVWAAPYGTVTKVWEEITAVVLAEWPAGIKAPDRKGVQTKYNELVERTKKLQASASGRSGQHDEKEEPWLRTLLDNIDATQTHESMLLLNREEKERKEVEQARRHIAVREDAMQRMGEKRDRGEQSESGENEESKKKPRSNVRGLLQQSLELGESRHLEQMEVQRQGLQVQREGQEGSHSDAQMINRTLQHANNLFAQWLSSQQQQRE